jgi:hypothetical protein
LTARDFILNPQLAAPHGPFSSAVPLLLIAPHPPRSEIEDMNLLGNPEISMLVRVKAFSALPEQ